ncbi:MAG: 30S ribosome-binding factor RbfA [Candidatus Krumholzibacteriota bacterium]|nr:30S ribosome-binding factor RbfA [Candidatus Krumholzibacteriota bacterium]
MSNKYKARKKEAIREFVAELIMKKVKDPRVANVTVQKIDAADDFSVAKIYYNIIGRKDDIETVQEGLRSCKGFIRSKIRKHIRMKVIPELIFKYDESLDKAMRIEKIINKIHDEQEDRDLEDEVD